MTMRLFLRKLFSIKYPRYKSSKHFDCSSTDSALKLWDRETEICKRTFTGHLNEKNFVGLSINGDWISCGSENNTLYTYHKASSDPVTQFKFPSANEESVSV